MKSVIEVSKVQYADFFRLLLDRYASVAKIEIDRESFGPGDIERLKSTWCTRRRIRDTREFRLWDAQREVVSFHDSIDELFISTEEIDWMRELSNKGVLRYRVLPVIESSGFLRSVATRISSALSFGRKRPIQPPEPKSTAAPRRRSRLRQIVRIT